MPTTGEDDAGGLAIRPSSADRSTGPRRWRVCSASIRMQSRGWPWSPELGVDSAQQIMAEVGAKAATFRLSQEALLVGRGMPGGEEESAGREPPQADTRRRGATARCAAFSNPSGECCCQTQGEHLRDRVPSSSAAPRTQQNHRRDCASPLSPDRANFLHKGVRYEVERGPAVSEKSRQRRTARMVRTLRILGYRVEPLANPA